MTHTERLRFAPSPTGDLHVGGARAALFNWLYARKVGGKFLLRIEDTDTERSSETALESILGSLQWLGIEWDEPPVFQSKRSDLYRAAVRKLLKEGKAYRCFCTVEELEAEREHARAESLQYHYSGKCRNLTEAEVDAKLAAGEPFTVRFRVPPGSTGWHDLVHEQTTFENASIGDFIIARADGSPVYLLGVAVDDADMGITLVMRGDDHLSNTPKQIMLMETLGAAIPHFAHLPQVLGGDKKKLSKRHGAASVLEYRKMGFLPEALVNFLALLGWNPGDEREQMSLDELIGAFTIENISKKSGVFDIQKLEWLNSQYLHEKSDDELLTLSAPWFVERELITTDDLARRSDYLLRVIGMLKLRSRLLPDLASQAEYFFRPPASYEEKGARKYFKADSAEILEMLAGRFEALAVFDEPSLEEATRVLSEEREISAGKLIHPTRLAVTGVTFGPGLFELLTLIGREEVVGRMRAAVSFIRSQAPAE